MTRGQKQLAATVAVLVFMLLVVVFAQSGGQSGGAAQSGGKASGGAASQSGGVYTAEQAKAGEQLYTQNCQSCHGDDLQGEVGPGLAGSNFSKKWERGNLTADDLYYIMSTTMPKGSPGSLKPEQYVNILAFVLQQNGYPAGESPLPTDESSLKKIKLTVH